MKKINSKGLIDHYDSKKPENEISRRQDFFQNVSLETGRFIQ